MTRSQEKRQQEEKILKGMAISIEVTRKTLLHLRSHNHIDRIDNLLGMIQLLDEEEAEIFDLDLRKIDNNKSAKTYMYGVGRYYCGLDLISPSDDM